jgi:hypothetical protein
LSKVRRVITLGSPLGKCGVLGLCAPPAAPHCEWLNLYYRRDPVSDELSNLWHYQNRVTDVCLGSGAPVVSHMKYWSDEEMGGILLKLGTRPG